MRSSVTRRRAIGITAAAAGLSLLPLGRPARAEAHLVTWRGSALGAVATMRIHHSDRAAAGRLIEQAVAEVRRLEAVFSLYRDDSALAALNRDGVLVAPPADLVAVLEASRRAWELTGGAFDPTVQALWTLYREHFTRRESAPSGPSPAALAAALAKVGFGRVAFDRNRVVLGRRGMSLTLNGIAQGYATDRVVAILRQAGIDRSLVDMGEDLALGPRPDGSAWRIGIADPDRPERVGEVLEVVDRAVATSGGYGFAFDREGRFHHLLDPGTGRPAARYKSLTVVAAAATVADALSTGFSILPRAAVARALRSLGEGEVHLITASGERATLTA